MNVYTIDSTTKSVVNTSKVDLDNECYQIVSNSVDKVAIGGELNKVDIHTLPEEGFDITKECL